VIALWKKLFARRSHNAMNGRTGIALVLIILGTLTLVYQGFTYTTKKKVVDLGPIQATKEEHHTVPLPPLLGAIALVGGIVVLVSGRRDA
jgi:uncharacterized membrane protein YidH (DUF202 family)